MKTNMNEKSNRFSTACVSTCKKLMSQFKTIRQAIVREYSDTKAAHARLLELALNEAEALARQTSYPHLFFPVLAEEKARAVRSWSVRQRAVRRSELTQRPLA